MRSAREFLIGYGHEPDIIDWKYYDQCFNAGRERGFACVDDGRIVAFLGVIPFTVIHDGKAIETAWSCDWYRDPNASGPLGIMLIQHALKAYPLIYSFGGSEVTKAIMGQLSRVTIPTAGLELYKPVRVGGALHALQRAARVKHVPSWSAINNIKVPISGRKSGEGIEANLLEALPDSLEELFKERLTEGHVPAYNVSYLRWLLERCPSITGGVCLVSRGEELLGAVLFWCLVNDRRFWRMSLLSRRREYEMLEAGMRRTIHHIRESGGWLISLLASRLDDDLLKMASQHGFYRSNSRRPLYILTRQPGAKLQELERLSYLDTDYAYRFPGASS